MIHVTSASCARYVTACRGMGRHGHIYFGRCMAIVAYTRGRCMVAAKEEVVYQDNGSVFTRKGER